MRTFWNFYQEEPEETEERPGEQPGEARPRPADVIDISGEIVAGEDWARVGGACFATDFRRALDGVGDVTVRINSPGGDVLAGAEIYSALREHALNGKGRVRVEIMALAASAASVIAMAGDEIYMYPTAYMMIHNPWTGAVGDAREMRKTAKILDELARGLINAYKIKTGKTEDQLKKMLDAETWMSAGTCVMEGFADGVIGAGHPAAAMAGGEEARVMMAARSHGLQDVLAMYRAEETEPGEPEEGEEPEEEPAEPEEEPETEETEPDARAEETKPEEDPEPEEEPETEETEPEARAEETDPEEEPEEDPEEEPEEEPEEPEEPEDMARMSARAALAEEIVAVRILMAQGL